MWLSEAVDVVTVAMLGWPRWILIRGSSLQSSLRQPSVRRMSLVVTARKSGDVTSGVVKLMAF
jgi:hypothetical protein